MRYTALFFLSFISLAQALDYGTYEVEKAEPIPLREFSVIVTDTGYYPKNLVAFEGEKVRFYVTTTERKRSCFTLPTHNIFLSANPTSINEGEAVFQEPGRYKFYCPVGNISGYLTVLKNKPNAFRAPAALEKKEEKKVSRRPELWMPRDF